MWWKCFRKRGEIGATNFGGTGDKDSLRQKRTLERERGFETRKISGSLREQWRKEWWRMEMKVVLRRRV